MYLSRPTTGAAAIALAVSLLACSDDNTALDAPATQPSPTPETAVPTSSTTTTTSSTTTTTSPPSADTLTDELKGMLDDALQSTAIAWDAGGDEAPPTAASVAVRIPGRDDIIVASGQSVDGTPFNPEAPFNVGSLTESLVQTVAYQLVDEGILDPNATIDQWLPAQPNASAITVQMLLDGTHGWAPFGTTPEVAIPADLTRHWTLAEVLATVESHSPFADPGTFSAEGTDVAVTALAAIAEHVTGTTLAQLVEARVAQPGGLDDTAISDGNEPPGFEDGIFTFNGQRADTSTFPHTAYNTYNTAYASANSTLRDLLDLLDLWRRGDFFTTDRVPGPHRLPAERLLHTDASPTGFVMGYGIPFNGYCPCQPHDEGTSVTAIGRAPTTLGTDNHIFHYPADGVSVVLHFNGSDWVDREPIRHVVDAIHDAATSS
jgi:CubicO group peptidase (beta-lactamase class C family)